MLANTFTDMQFNDTSNRTGIIQRIEKQTGLGDAGITGNSVLLKVMTQSVNNAYDEIMPLLLSYSDTIRFDDTNHTDLPIGTLNIVSGQPDYTITVDDNSLDILNITDVRILGSATATLYADLTRVTLDDPLFKDIMSPNTGDTGTPQYWLENNNTIFLYPKPNYNATNGIKIYFERIESYFVSTDTTKVPGIPRIFHSLLADIPSHEWLCENKPANTAMITRLEAKIAMKKRQLSDIIATRNPSRTVITTAPIQHR